MVHCRVLGVGFRIVNLLSIWFQASGLWSIVNGYSLLVWGSGLTVTTDRVKL
jgi:hypothetical protein